MNQRCILSVFITLNYLPNPVFAVVTSHILSRLDSILASYTDTSDTLKPFCNEKFQWTQNSKWTFSQTDTFAIFAFPDSHWHRSLFYSRKSHLETLLWKMMFFCYSTKQYFTVFYVIKEKLKKKKSRKKKSTWNVLQKKMRHILENIYLEVRIMCPKYQLTIYFRTNMPKFRQFHMSWMLFRYNQ